MKKVQIGARISHEDAEFISQLQIEGARTPSDKLRAIIEQARKSAENKKDFSGLYRQTATETTALVEYVKKEELTAQTHSAVVEKVLTWLPEFYAYTLSAIDPDKEENDLVSYEKGLLERAFRLLESIIHLELSRTGSSYTHSVVGKHLESVKDLIQVIHELSMKQEKQQ